MLVGILLSSNSFLMLFIYLLEYGADRQTEKRTGQTMTTGAT